MSTGVGPDSAAVLAEQVRARLAVLDLQAAGMLRRPVDVAELRGQLRGLIGAWRRLLAAHHPADGKSRCPRCRSWWGGPRRWPCPVWRTAHTSLAIHQLPAPDVVITATPVRAPNPARPGSAREFPIRQLPDQSPAGRNAPRAGGTPGAATPDPGLPPPGTAAPGTSRPPDHHPAPPPWQHRSGGAPADITSSAGLGPAEAGQVSGQSTVFAGRARELDGGGAGRGAAGR